MSREWAASTPRGDAEGGPLHGEGRDDRAQVPAPQRHHGAREHGPGGQAEGPGVARTRSWHHQAGDDGQDGEDERGRQDLRARGTAAASPSRPRRPRPPPRARPSWPPSAASPSARPGRRSPWWRCPTGRTGSPAATAAAPSRIASPSVTSASSGPAYSRTIASWIIVSSRCVEGLSTGIRPVSATMTMSRAARASSRCRRRRPLRVGEGRGDDPRQVRGPGLNGQGEDRDQQRRLGERPDRHRPARPHPAERGARVQAGERDRHRAQQEQEDDDERVGGTGRARARSRRAARSRRRPRRWRRGPAGPAAGPRWSARRGRAPCRRASTGPAGAGGRAPGAALRPGPHLAPSARTAAARR